MIKQNTMNFTISNLLIFIDIISLTKQDYYISSYVYKVDDCVTKVSLKDNENVEIIYLLQSDCNYLILPKEHSYYYLA